MSPLVLLGGEFIGYGMVKLARALRRSLASPKVSFDSPLPLRILVIAILIPYFIFNSGAVFELSRSQTTHFIDTPYSIALSSYRVDVSTVFTKQDLVAADWLSKVVEEGRHIYVDYHSSKLLSYGIDGTSWLQLELLGMAQVGLPSQVYKIYPDIKELSLPSYIYLRTWNTQKEALTFGTVYAGRQSLSFDDLPWLTQALAKSDKIYDNKSAQVLFIPRD